jgi:hypothetical protein
LVPGAAEKRLFGILTIGSYPTRYTGILLVILIHFLTGNFTLWHGVLIERQLDAVCRQVDLFPVKLTILSANLGKSTKKRLPQLKSTQLYYSTAHQPPEARKQGNLNFPQIVCFVGLGQLDCFFRQVDHLIPVWFGQVDRFPVKLTGLKVVSPCARLKIYFCLKWFLSCIWVLRKSPSPLKRCDSRNLILPTFDPVNLTWSS